MNPFREWHDAGYRELIPIVPPGAALHPKSHYSKAPANSIGKQPGIPWDGGLWGTLKGWSTIQADDEALDAWGACGASVGLRCGEVVTIDIDAMDLAQAEQIERIAIEMLGPAPVRIGQAPKRALLYRGVGELKFPKVRFLGASGAIEQIEMPKQLVIDGVHAKTGKPYQWPRGRPSFDKLSLVDQGTLDTFRGRVRSLLPPVGSDSAASVDRDKVDQTGLRGDAALIERAVAAIPNKHALFDYDGWVKIAAALRAALPDDYETGLRIFEEFSERTDLLEPEEDAARVFGSVNPPFAVGAGYLLDLAAKHSSTGSAIKAELWLDSQGSDAPLFPETSGGTVPAGHLPEPIDIFGDASPAELGRLPSNSVPSAVLPWIASEARRKGVPEAFAAACAVGAVSAAIGNSLRIQVRQHDTEWTEPASLWICLVGEPGSGKSPIISEALRPLRDQDRDWAQVDMPRHARWLETKRKPPGGIPLPEPSIRRAVVDDVTLEKQIKIHADNPRGILRAPDELVSLLGALGAYKKDGSADRGQMLRFFDGGSITVDRVSSAPVRADCALMSLLAGTQPEKIAKLTSDLGADGMLQRFLFFRHDGSRRTGADEAPDREAQEAYRRLVRGLASAPAGCHILRMTPEAQAVFRASTGIIKTQAELPGASSAWRGHVEKWEKILARLTLCFHAVEMLAAFGEVFPEMRIDPETVTRASNFARLSIRHGLRFYEEFFGAAAAASEAREIAGYLLTKPELNELNRRTIYDARKNLRGDENRRLLQAVMRELEEAGWCLSTGRDSDGPARWIINPLVRERFSERAKREASERAARRERIREASELRRNWTDTDNVSGGAAK
ncbi:DUF3987 domain-containing protein [Bosea sp. NPDC003192]|uniref:DUF3987 domain-containing protein n=1 Tax=Bosea sp. NPDC003192 TaxID=3390551 RepID=UPI003CFCB21E